MPMIDFGVTHADSVPLSVELESKASLLRGINKIY